MIAFCSSIEIANAFIDYDNLMDIVVLRPDCNAQRKP